ncbi:MAG: YggT family protein [Bifidobacteriaceae bacterium]|nr:YggT family protein [Bifidobacteriaceae bacterium]
MVATAYVIWGLAQLYLLVLVIRLILDLVMAFSRSWRPQKGAAAAAEIVFVVTDPPLRLARKLIKPVRIGPMALDLAFPVVMVAVSVVAYAATAVVGAAAS